jgi:hypothetical protein
VASPASAPHSPSSRCSVPRCATQPTLHVDCGAAHGAQGRALAASRAVREVPVRSTCVRADSLRLDHACAACSVRRNGVTGFAHTGLITQTGADGSATGCAQCAQYEEKEAACQRTLERARLEMEGALWAKPPPRIDRSAPAASASHAQEGLSGA